MNMRALITNTVIGAAMQLVMILAGHWNEFVKLNLFALVGTLISLVAALLYARAARRGAAGAPICSAAQSWAAPAP